MEADRIHNNIVDEVWVTLQSLISESIKLINKNLIS